MQIKKQIKIDKTVGHKASLSTSKMLRSLHTALSKKHFYPGRERRSQRDLQGPPWHDTKQQFYVVCQVYAKKKKKRKINATWQRYIKSLCAVIFLFYFCLGCRESLSKAQRGAKPRRTMSDPGRRENGTCCLFSAASSVTFFFSFNRPFHVSTSSVTSGGL